TSIQLCSPNDGCLPATSFSWGKPDPSVTRAFVSKGIWSGPVLEDSGQLTPLYSTDPRYGQLPAVMFIPADFDGDGRSDLIMRFPLGQQPITLYRNTGSGFAASTALPGLGLDNFIIATG